MSLATGSENEGYKRAKENRPTVDCACGDGIETLFTGVRGWQAASNELDEVEDEEQEDIGDNEHGKAMIN